MNAIERGLAVIGGIRAAAIKLNVDHSTVSGWKRSGRLPAGRVLAFEAAAKFQVTRHELRPDLYPKDTPNLPPAGSNDSLVAA